MQRIVLHHTAGGLKPTAFDKQHYHRLVDGDGEVQAGLHPISANAPGRQLTAGRYAAHTRGLNTGSIGVSMACMANAQWHDPRACKAFPTPVQVEAMIAEVARLCRAYSIPVDRRTVLSHAEVQTTLGIAQAGKWDFDYDPFGILDSRDPVRIGDMLRDRISAALGDVEPQAPRGPMPVIRRGSKGEAVAMAQRALGLAADGIFGPATETAVVAFQRKHELLPDGIVGRATWAALNLEN
ncbi:peptidoglycan recognition protein family protein [Paracoccus sp. 22332]|uniref:peptidoglycan recognition protein family protein n=1 Tax=Paracoccus sp. 22332 TaxID=3453913 RepID=UPI003F82741A